MRASLQRVGNSHGIIIPKPLLAQLGFEREVEIDVEDDALVIRKPTSHPRAGWSDASRALAESSDDALIWPEFSNADDGELVW